MNGKWLQFYVVCSVALICATNAVAMSPDSRSTGKQALNVKMLKRSQWLNKIGDVAKNPDTAKEVLKQVAAGDKVEFTKRLINAITLMPQSPEEKLALLIKSSVACIGSTSLDNGERYKVIAEVLAVTPVQFLPGLVAELSKRFNLKLNDVSPDQYKGMATDVFKIAVERNKTAEDSSARNTFMALLLLGATTPQETPGLQDIFMGALPDDSNRALAKNWIVEAQKGNFQPILTAADAGNPVIPPSFDSRDGGTQPEGLLGNIGGLTGSFRSGALNRNSRGFGKGGGNNFPGAGGQGLPRTYPNQRDRL